jgi:pantoate--beta-alanine ligase
VPTMGALHAGHMHLVEVAKQQADHVIVSIFVNPRQFGPKEDLSTYPRTNDTDAALLAEAGVAVVWMPGVEDMYPPGYATSVLVTALGDGLCGAARPGHFDGVATVVAKLFNQVRPDIAIFGEKDWQQLAVIRRMASDLDLGVDVIGVPTVRNVDGLALSSRNAYLTKAERASASGLAAALKAGVAAIEGGASVTQVIDGIAKDLTAAGFDPIDYINLCGAEDLQVMATLDRPARLLAAARMGKARLIDNMAVNPPPKK